MQPLLQLQPKATTRADAVSVGPQTSLRPKPATPKPPSKEDTLNRTRIMPKPSPHTSSATPLHLLLQNGRPTAKSRTPFSPSAKPPPLARGLLHYSPAGKHSRGLWEPSIGHFGYLQSVHQASQVSPKPRPQDSHSPTSVKLTTTPTLQLFLSSKHPQSVLAPALPPSKKLVLLEQPGWSNKLAEAPVKLRMPDRHLDHPSKKENPQRTCPAPFLSPTNRKTKPPHLDLAAAQSPSRPSLLSEAPRTTKGSPGRLKQKTRASNSKETLRDNDLLPLLTSPSLLSALDLPLVLSVAQTLDALSQSLRRAADPSLLLKKYTELVQDQRYCSLEALFSPRNPAKAGDPEAFSTDFRLCLRVEALAVMHVFLGLVEHSAESAILLSEAIELCCASSHLVLLALRLAFTLHSLDAQTPALTAHLQQLSGLPAKASLPSLAKKIRRNNGAVLSRLTALGRHAPFAKVSPALAALLPSLLSIHFERAIESIFECFFEVLKQRGAMSVLYHDAPRDSAPRPVEPNFILQPSPAAFFLPPKTKAVPLTLVLDLDETLVHYAQVSNESGEFYIRPFSQEFLVELSPLFEIVIFTAAVKVYADWILDRLDLTRVVSHRLYRCSTKPQKGVFIKDLSRLGRELSKTIIVDNNPDNFQYQAENGIFIKSWYDDPHDTALEELCRLLRRVARRGDEDVRLVLADLRRQMTAPRPEAPAN